MRTVSSNKGECGLEFKNEKKKKRMSKAVEDYLQGGEKRTWKPI